MLFLPQIKAMVFNRCCQTFTVLFSLHSYAQMNIIAAWMVALRHGGGEAILCDTPLSGWAEHSWQRSDLRASGDNAVREEKKYVRFKAKARRERPTRFQRYAPAIHS